MLQASFASYSNAYGPRQGVIVAKAITSPTGIKEEFENKDLVLPELGRWSDVTWLTWENLCEQNNADPGALKYIFHSNVINPETHWVKDTIIVGQPNVWPGIRFSVQNEEGLALLGSPNCCSSTLWLHSELADNS